jgi:DNA-3-methyladenine glycosylase II
LTGLPRNAVVIYHSMSHGSGQVDVAVRRLRRADPVLADVIRRVGPCSFAPRTDGTHFEALVRAIVYQQLSGKAAATIYSRVVATLGCVTPESLRAAGNEDLRAAGLSRQKVGYLRDLADKAHAGLLPVDRLDELDDTAVMESLCAVRGIGRWTVHMFLMFRLGRLDVLPELDLGVRKAVQRAFRMRGLPSPERLERVSIPWQPYRTIASWYLWRSLELPAAPRSSRARSGRTGSARRQRQRTVRRAKAR